jgi:hypothetical protein
MYVAGPSYDKLGLNQLRNDADRVFKLRLPTATIPGAACSPVQRNWWEVWR